ncbi:MAG: FlgD immunoglobulin-like domain containing protein, partial [bacterium]
KGADFVILALHTSLFRSDKKENGLNSSFLQFANDLSAKIDLIACAHEHYYQRTHRMLSGTFQAPAGAPGCYVMINGGGGAGKESEKGYDPAWAPLAVGPLGRQIHDYENLFYTHVTVNGKTMNLKTIQFDGLKEVDNFDITAEATGIKSITFLEYSSVIKFPNPYHPGDIIHYNAGDINNMSSDIYDIKGNLVRTIRVSSSGSNTQISWDGRDNHGNPVSCGSYLICFLHDNQRKQKSVMLIR